MTLNNTDNQYYSDISIMNRKLADSLQKRLEMYDELSKKYDSMVSKIETLNNGFRYLELENKELMQKNQNLLNDNTLIFNDNNKLRTDFQVYYNNYLSTNHNNCKLEEQNNQIQQKFNSIKDELLRIKTDHSNLIIKFKDILDNPNNTFYIKNEQIHRKKNCKFGTSCTTKCCIYRHVQLNDRQMTTAAFIKRKKDNLKSNQSKDYKNSYNRFIVQQYKHKNNPTENYEERQRNNLKRDRNNYENYQNQNGPYKNQYGQYENNKRQRR